MMVHAYCWFSGLIEFGRTVPPGAISFLHGERDEIVPLVQGCARLAYDNRTLYVPHVRDALTEAQKAGALAEWMRLIRIRFGTRVRDAGVPCHAQEGA